jgi:hypothetical protein
MTRTEDDLRDALRSLEQFAPSADDVLRAVSARTGSAVGGPAYALGAARIGRSAAAGRGRLLVGSRAAGRGRLLVGSRAAGRGRLLVGSRAAGRGRLLVGSFSARRRRLFVAAVATAAAVAITAAAVLVSGQAVGGQVVSHQFAGYPVAGVQNGSYRGTPPSLRARLLAAITSARRDILVTHWPGITQEREWAWPWYPRPGQAVRVRIQEFFPSGPEVKDLVYSFTMPRHPVTRFPGPITWGTLTVPGTYIVINHMRHTWGAWHHVTFDVALPLDPAAIQREVISGRLSVLGQATYAGHRAVKLNIALPARHTQSIYATRAILWVDAKTYLPLHQLLQLSDGERFPADYTFLPPTAANLAVLHPRIPAGYRYWTTQNTGRSPKT